MSDQEFDTLISRAMDELPQDYIRRLDNVAITYADEPTREQLVQQKVKPGYLLLGLYEGIPQTQRGSGYALVLPDKITLFKYPILRVAGPDPQEIFAQITRTLWHEIAHHYGLNHDRIHAIQHD